MKIVSATIVRGHSGPDNVFLKTDLPEPTYPYKGNLSLSFVTAAEYAEEYISRHFDFNVEDITVIIA